MDTAGSFLLLLIFAILIFGVLITNIRGASGMGINLTPSYFLASGAGDFHIIEDARRSKDSIRKGNPIECSAEDYRSEIRDALVRFALVCVRNNDTGRMRITLAEVNKLDRKHGFGPSAESPDKLT
jgi:hypothetical protein